MSGKVYFVSAPGRIKIGYTSQPERRLRDLQCVDMEELTTLAVINGTRKTEKKLHALLAPYRLRGEWFNDCPAVRVVIERAQAGEFTEVVTVKKDTAPPQPHRDPDFPMAVITAAIDRCGHLTTQIEDRMRRREEVFDLAREIQFLAETVIGPGLYGAKNKPETHIGFDPPLK